MFPFRHGSLPPAPVSAHLRRRQIRGLKGKRGLSAPYFPISALPHRPPPGGLGCDPLRGEPAITGLDWSFAPRPRSWERFARQHPFGPSRGFRPASPYPGLDRSVSGLTAMAPGPLRTPPLTEACLALAASLLHGSRVSRDIDCGQVGFPTPSGVNPLNSPQP